MNVRNDNDNVVAWLRLCAGPGPPEDRGAEVPRVRSEQLAVGTPGNHHPHTYPSSRALVELESETPTVNPNLEFSVLIYYLYYLGFFNFNTDK